MNLINYLNQNVRVKVDRPLGSKHAKHGFIYPVNYGFVPDTISGDGEELDCYVLGVFEPLNEFTGKCIAIIHRINDNDDKLIIVPENRNFSNKEIDVLNIFESAIDLMSFQTLEKLHKRNWKKNNYLSLSGVTAIGNSIEESELPIALGKFLKINPQIKVLNLYLDNDQAGKNSIAKINYLLGKSYQIYDKGPKKMKDVNEVLTRKFKQKEEYSR